MSEILNVRRPSDFNSFHGIEVRHPLVSVIEYEDISPIKPSVNRYDVYGLFLHTNLTVNLRYGCGRYDCKNGILICVAPGQVGGAEGDTPVDVNGWSLLFHPDLLHGTALEKNIQDYTFFDYRVNEALHLTEREQNTLASIIRAIRNELESEHDSVQDKIIVSLIETLLNYSKRFYNRQFAARSHENADILARLELTIKKYFTDNMQAESGLPNVQFCAERLNMSANYLGDVVKKLTGEPVSRYIKRFTVQQAKNELASGKSVSEVAYSLGFGYPQHFTRLFRKETGYTPSEFITRLKRGEL